MADSSLEAHLSLYGVSPGLISSLMVSGWTMDSFAACTDSASGFDDLWGEMFPDQSELALVQKASIKAAWKKLQLLPAPSQAPDPASQAASSVNSWNEVQAPKLSAQTLAELKRAFFRDYPSEVLSPDTCPSSRLIAMAHAQVQKKDIAWIPWKYRLSHQRLEEVQMARPTKMAKTEHTSLHQLLWDDPPSIEVSNANMGYNGIRNMLELNATAYALVQGCHLGRIKAYNLKFLGLISTRLDSDLGLRHVTVLEAQAADRMLWGIIADLTTDKGWTLNDSLHEVTVLRSDMIGLLQPRPKTIPRSFPSETTTVSNTKGKGRGKSKSKKGASSGNPKWVSTQMQGTSHSICMRYQSGTCSNSNCRFKHVCAIPKSDGTACGGNHSAKDHNSTPH
jgi:hypothetical protein